MAKFEVKHGGYGTKLYYVWTAMNYRTSNPNHKHYSNYGGKGITVCDAWKKDFAAFREWALSNGYKEGLTIDRIDNDKGYSPDNCRWVGMEMQNNNRSFNHLITYEGHTYTIAELCRSAGLSRSLFDARLRLGWTVERILTTPVQTKYSKAKKKEVI